MPGAVAVYLGVAVLSRAVGFLLVPLYTRRMTVAEYGDLALAQSATALLPMVLTLGIVSAVPRAFFRGKDAAEGMRQAGHVGAWATVLSLAAGALVELAIVSLIPPHTGRSIGRLEASCVLVAAVGLGLTSIPSVVFRAAQKPVTAALFQVLEALSLAGFTVLFVLVRRLALRGALLALACTYSLNGLLAIYVVFVHLGGRPAGANLRDLVKFSFPFVPHFVANWAQSAADRWVLKGAGYGATLGAFALASQVLTPATMTLLAVHDYASATMGEAFRQRGLYGLRLFCGRQRMRYFVAALVPTLACVAAIPLVPYV
ncbi:MAG TPA: oligosaccharide flippase family protein, partial [Polyangiaceae bacterium]|nr:oligosaccharide flippase family protein [Polyangiaceae bacterium]